MVRRSMYPVVFIVHSILLLARFSLRWESAHFFCLLWGGQKKTPGRSRGRGKAK